MTSRNGARGEYAGAVLLELIGAGAALGIAVQTWQVVVTRRPRPLADDVLHVSGRAVDAAPTALALVALAGVVAVLATRGTVRRVVGVLVALAGAGLVWRSVSAAGAISASRARQLVTDAHPTVDVTVGGAPAVSAQVVWPVLSVVCGVLVLLAGLLVATRGHRWVAMSARYDSATTSPEAERADPERTARTLWSALDRGDDPTTRDG